MIWGQTQKNLSMRIEKESRIFPLFDHFKKKFPIFKIICHLEIKLQFVILIDYKKMNALLAFS